MSVTVNSVEISEPAILAEMQYHPASTVDEARRQAAEALVVRQLLLQRAAQLGIAPCPGKGERAAQPDEEETLVRALIEAEVHVPEADERVCRRYFDNNRRTFRSPDLFEGAHILFAASPDDAEARAAAKEAATKVIDELTDHPRRFAELARTLSDCTSAENGGNLGQIAKGDAVAEFETFLFNLEEGQLCPVPVETRYGIHVVRLDRRILGQALPFEAVQDRIAARLEERSWRTAVSQYIKLLAGAARIDGLELGGATTPLVQ